MLFEKNLIYFQINNSNQILSLKMNIITIFAF